MIKQTKCQCSIFSVIRPESNLKFYWELFMTPILVVLGFIVPNDAVFIDKDSAISINLVYVCSAVFRIEIIITLNSGIFI